VVVLGCGEDASCLGKRRQLCSARVCWVTLFCRKILLTGGDGSLTLSKVTLFEGLTSISRHLIHLRSRACRTWCG